MVFCLRVKRGFEFSLGFRVESLCFTVTSGFRVLGGSWDLVSRVISTLIGVKGKYNCSYLTYNPQLLSPMRVSDLGIEL